MLGRTRLALAALVAVLAFVFAFPSARADDKKKDQKGCVYCANEKAILDNLSKTHCPAAECKDKGANCSFCKGFVKRAGACDQCPEAKNGLCKDCEKAIKDAKKALKDAGKDPSCDFCVTRAIVKDRIWCSEKCQKAEKTDQMCDMLRKWLDEMSCDKCDKKDAKK